VTTPEEPRPLSAEELAAETGAALPDKEVISLLDLNADLNIALDAAAPIDLAAAANANVAAPIDAAVGANVLSVDSTSQSLADQGTLIHQNLTGDATATATQDSGITQGATTADTTAPAADATAPAADATAPAAASALPDTSGALDGDLLNVNVNLAADLNLAAPIDGAVAANANAAAPIDAAVSANIGSIGSDATAVAQQDAIIDQNIDANATATADQASQINQ
jgi:hypothetical protein